MPLSLRNKTEEDTEVYNCTVHLTKEDVKDQHPRFILGGNNVALSNQALCENS